MRNVCCRFSFLAFLLKLLPPLVAVFLLGYGEGSTLKGEIKMSSVLLVVGVVLLIIVLIAIFFSFSSIVTAGTELYIGKPIQKKHLSIWSRIFVKIQQWRYRRLLKRYHSLQYGRSPKEDRMKCRYQEKMLRIASTIPQTPEEEKNQRISFAVGNLALSRPERDIKDIEHDVAFADKKLNR